LGAPSNHRLPRSTQNTTLSRVRARVFACFAFFACLCVCVCVFCVSLVVLGVCLGFASSTLCIPTPPHSSPHHTRTRPALWRLVGFGLWSSGPCFCRSHRGALCTFAPLTFGPVQNSLPSGSGPRHTLSNCFLILPLNPHNIRFHSNRPTDQPRHNHATDLASPRTSIAKVPGQG
jgi:hypothetical protein